MNNIIENDSVRHRERDSKDKNNHNMVIESYPDFNFLLNILFNHLSPGLQIILLGSVPYVPGGQISHAVIKNAKKEKMKKEIPKERERERERERKDRAEEKKRKKRKK